MLASRAGQCSPKNCGRPYEPSGLGPQTLADANLVQRKARLRVYILSPRRSRQDRRYRNNHDFPMHHKSPAAIARRSAFGALRAFTVLEIMVVIAIIGMLVGLTVANLDKLLGDSKVDLAGVFVKSSIKVPLQQYSMHMGDYPTTAEGLQALITAPASKADRWRGPYLQEGTIPLDPWKRPYQYRYPGTHNKNGYDVYSLGQSGQEDEKTIIGNW